MVNSIFLQADHLSFQISRHLELKYGADLTNIQGRWITVSAVSTPKGIERVKESLYKLLRRFKRSSGLSAFHQFTLLYSRNCTFHRHNDRKLDHRWFWHCQRCSHDPRDRLSPQGGRDRVLCRCGPRHRSFHPSQRYWPLQGYAGSIQCRQIAVRHLRPDGRGTCPVTEVPRSKLEDSPELSDDAQ